ncbi:MAG: hypothetical protein QM758_24080 [Armatimonas sp.]
MKGILRNAALCGLATMVIGGAAQAQEGRYKVNSTAVKAGLFMPSGKEARNGGGHQIFALEADYVAQYIPERNQTNVVSVGYIEKGALRLVPMTLNQLFHDNKGKTRYDVYYGYGIGVYSARLSNLDNSNGSKLLLGGALTAGWNINDKSFLEAKYHLIFNYNKKDVGGLLLMYGLPLLSIDLR